MAYLLLEDGSKILLEDLSGALLLEPGDDALLAQRVVGVTMWVCQCACQHLDVTTSHEVTMPVQTAVRLIGEL